MLLNTSNVEIWSILCIQFCFMHGLYIYEIKNLIWKFSAFDQFSKNIK